MYAEASGTCCFQSLLCSWFFRHSAPKKPRRDRLLLTAKVFGSQSHASQNHKMGTYAFKKIHEIELSTGEGNNIDQNNEDYPHDHEDDEQKFRNGYLCAKKPQQDKDSRGNGADRQNKGANIGYISPEDSVCGLADFTAPKKLVGKTQYPYGEQIKGRRNV
jgi:hypothetical protein